MDVPFIATHKNILNGLVQTPNRFTLSPMPALDENQLLKRKIYFNDIFFFYEHSG